MEVSGTGQPVNRYAIGAWLLLLLVGVAAYAPGLSGPFLFDDFAVLGKLGKYGGVVDWASFKAYLFGGTAGPTGRPVALLSFLVDGNNWPTEVGPFKRTNLIIHLLTGSVLAVLTRQILRLLGRDSRQASLVAVLAAGCWLLHPFLVSTTLYVVQRMAQLATLFILAGLVGHLYGRSLAQTRPLYGYGVMTLSMGVFTVLATLSKENGALLPLLVGVLEITVLAASRLAPLDRRWSALFLVAPAVLIGAFLAYKAIAYGFFNALAPRDFSVYERLLTQPRVLSEYLGNWFIPKIYTTGVFQDHIIPSRGLLSPAATALHLVLHVGAIVAAILLRRRYALAAFAVLFFYAGHLVESTTLNLELYFEHRNYLPAAFLFLPLLTLLREHTSLPLFVVITSVFLLVLGGFSRYSAGVWSDYSSIVEASARKAPMSTRVQSEYAKILFNHNRYDEALAVIDEAIERHNEVRPQLVMTRSIILCKLAILDDAELRQATARLASVIYDRRLLGIYEEFLLAVINGDCPRTSLDAARGVFAAMLEHPPNAEPDSPRYAQIQYFMGLADSRNENVERAVSQFERSLAAEPSVSAALNIAAILASAQHFTASLGFIERARELERQDVRRADGARVYGASDIDELEKTIVNSMNAAQAAEPT
jgi:tetratricopeptide (TPR) repeat protein